MIRPRSGWIAIDWQEMWSHRELLFFLVWRDISVRYKQTVLGPAWAVLQPLMMMADLHGHLRPVRQDRPPRASPTRCSSSPG